MLFQIVCPFWGFRHGSRAPFCSAVRLQNYIQTGLLFYICHDGAMMHDTSSNAPVCVEFLRAIMNVWTGLLNVPGSWGSIHPLNTVIRRTNGMLGFHSRVCGWESNYDAVHQN
jgi:hypothetical protein